MLFGVNHRWCWYAIRLDIVSVIAAPTGVRRFQIVDVSVQDFSPRRAGILGFSVKVAIAVP